MDKSKHFLLIVAIVITLLLIVSNLATPIPASTFIPASLTLSPTLNASPWPVATGSPVPTLAVFMTPDSAEVKRWKEYEDALAKAVFPPGTILKHANPGKFLCEWEFLGQTDQKVYVWAVCMSTLSLYNSETLAVIHIDMDGGIQRVEIPGLEGYGPDIRKLFPLDVQKMYFDKLIDFRRLSDHLRMRITHPEEPPLIAVPTP